MSYSYLQKEKQCEKYQNSNLQAIFAERTIVMLAIIQKRTINHSDIKGKEVFCNLLVIF